MYSAPKIAMKYLKYWFKSRNQYYLHSPFVYKLISEVIYDKKVYPVYDSIEKIRTRLKNSKDKVNMLDYGAKAKSDIDVRSIKSIVKSSAKSLKLASCLHRLVHHFQPKYMLEFGSSLGISTMYQALGNKDSVFTSMEGSPEVAEIAKANLSSIKCDQVCLEIGNFDHILDEQLEKFPQLDYVFFDGNHQEKPTIEYFEACLAKAHNETLFIFDDIHWSEGMEKAWDYIKSHEKVTVTIDLFFIGLVFFRKEQAKQDFVIRY